MFKLSILKATAVCLLMAGASPASAGVSCYIFCAACWVCNTTELCNPDNVSAAPGFRTQSTETEACGCKDGNEGACSDEAKCKIVIKNTKKYTVSGSIEFEGFGISGDTEDTEATEETCESNYKAVRCGQKGGKRGGKVFEKVTASGTEDCTWPESDKSYSGTLTKLTGCYCENWTPECD